MTAHWLPLNVEAPLAVVGGKAHHLARLAAFGCVVPRGFVLTAPAFRGFHGRTQTLSPAVERTISAALNESHLQFPVAVRSSAVGEDGTNASFAGQLDSFLGLSDDASVREAICKCYASYGAERAKTYRKLTGATLEGMGIIIQEMAPARVSGVMFTRAPDQTDNLLIECCEGLGEELVQGRVEPQAVAVVRTSLDLCSQLPSASLLPRERFQELARLGLELEQAWGAPQDIEWSFGPQSADGGEGFFLLQARPITTLTRRGPSPIVWSNANVNENYPEPLTPFLYSVASTAYYHYFRNLARVFGFSRARVTHMESHFHAAVGAQRGRLYYNLSAIHAAFRHFPLGIDLTPTWNEFVAVDHMTRAESRRWTLLGEVLALVRCAFQMVLVLATLEWRIRRFERRVTEAVVDRTRLPLSTLSGLNRNLAQFLTIRFQQWTDASLGDAAAMLGTAFHRWVARSLRVPAPVATAELARGKTISGDAITALRTLARIMARDGEFRAALATETDGQLALGLVHEKRFASVGQQFRSYLAAWGHRSPRELMLTEPDYVEAPERLLGPLRCMIAAADAPPDCQEPARATLGLYVTIATALLYPCTRLARYGIATRERARLKQSQLYAHTRQVLIAIGEQLVTRGTFTKKEDVFYLTNTELQQLLTQRYQHPSTLKELIALRRGEETEWRSQPPPPELIVGELTDADDPVADPTVTGMARWFGTGISAGIAAGNACVIIDPAEGHRLRPGNILVARQTDPGWAPLFAAASGLVIERGGSLSHAAIVARELGLPAVVGIKGATHSIPDGARIRLDATRGEVRLDG